MSARRPAGLHRPAGTLPARGFAPRLPYRPRIERYTRVIRVPISGLAGDATVISGTATVQLGPNGLGTRWYLTQANVFTSTGAADASTVALYLGSVALPNQLGGSSYAGGQDTIGLNVRPLDPGDLLIAVWSGAHNGDTATLVVYGEQDALDY